MLLRTSEKTAQQVIGHLDCEVWDKLADKAIEKMPKFKLAIQSKKIFDDFANLNSDGFFKSAGKIKEQKQQLFTFKENLIVGTTKLQQTQEKQVAQSMPHPIAQQGKNKKRLVSAIQLNTKREDKKENLFRLTIADLPNLQEEKIDETLRTAKYDNIRYNQSLQQSQKERRAMSEHRSIVEKKRFKEMKIFTYDYEGKLISLGHQKNPNSKINVVNMKPHFGNHVKTFRNSYQKFTKQQNILEILNKRVIGIRTPAIEPPKQTQKQKEQKATKHVKISQQTPNMLEYLKEDDKVQIGVTITDINNKSKFYGGNRNKEQIRNAKLAEFKGQFKQLQKFRDKLTLKKLKLKDPPQSQPAGMRTQYIESANGHRIQTEATDKESRLFTAATGTTRKRGRIDIKNQRLYTQNFVEDLE